MPPTVALAIACALAFYVYAHEFSSSSSVSGVFWPTLWYLVVASRPFGVWLNLWGVPLPGGSGDPTEGSIVDQLFYFIPTLFGLRILSRRGFDLGAALRANAWLAALLALMALSIIWSDYSYVSFKRYIKVVGSIVMALVVLTNDRPLPAMLTVLRRCLYIHLPMSIVCVKYFRNIGVSFDWSGAAEAWQGISTSKNTLGQIAMLGVIYFFWEVRRAWPEVKWRNLHLLYLAMAVYLLKGSEDSISMTSVAVCTFALIVFLRIQSLRSRPESVRPFVRLVFMATAGLIALVLAHSVFHFSPDSPFGRLITTFGRDITLTDRTYIWSDVYAVTGNPLLGVGFGGFWIGRLANIPWNSTMTWVLGQAHSGYVDTYLQLGLVGAFLLAGVMFTTLPRLVDSIHEDFDFGCLRITLFLTILFVNITETTFLRGDHHLWFMLLLVLWILPAAQAASVPADDFLLRPAPLRRPEAALDKPAERGT